MEEQYFFHVISDIPKKVGEHIILDDKHPNGVHKRVYEELETVANLSSSLIDDYKSGFANLVNSFFITLNIWSEYARTRSNQFCIIRISQRKEAVKWNGFKK